MYESLYRKYREQDGKRIFAHFPWRADIGETWQTPWARLAQMAQPEVWNFGNPALQQAGKDYPILQNYLNQTFLRAQDQGRIAYSEDGSKCCFNTGLQTTEFQDIYATFYLRSITDIVDQPDWTLYGFFPSVSNRLSAYPQLPEMVSYIDDPIDLIFNPAYPLDVEYEHILDNRDRLPFLLQTNPGLARHALEGAVHALRHRLKRNYQLATANWYGGRVQLLLPLELLHPGTLDLALVAERDDQQQRYLARTALTLDMAYNHARVIRRLDGQWLDNSRI